MKVWLFQTGEPLPVDRGNVRPMRAINLANALVAKGHRVVLWSSAFFHQEKRHRSDHYQAVAVNDRLEVRLIPSRGYGRNVGVGRLVDHAELAVRLRRLMDVATRWLGLHGVPSLLDGKDQWPEIFVQRVPGALRPILRAGLAPYAALGKRAMRDATGLTSMASAFLDWMREFSGRSPSPFDGVFPLSPTEEAIAPDRLEDAARWWAAQGVSQDGRHRFMFVGSFSHSMDFAPIQAAAARAIAEGRNWQFVICGDGARAAELRRLFAGMPNVVMPGWIDRPQAVALSSISTAGLAPYRNVPDFQMSVPNKIIDYLLLGQPIVTPLLGEVRSLIDRFDVGVAYDAGLENSLYECLCTLAVDETRREHVSQNARTLYRERFDGQRVYDDLVKLLERLAGSRDA
jgi:glycosyltransferase involved in cell wall biosynthesis